MTKTTEFKTGDRVRVSGFKHSKFGMVNTNLGSSWFRIEYSNNFYNHLAKELDLVSRKQLRRRG